MAYEPVLVRPAGTPYATSQEVIDEWVNRMFFTVENIRFEKLGAPMGDANGGTPAPTSVESYFSGRSLRDAEDALFGVQEIFGGPELAIRDLVPDDRAAILTDLDALFLAARDALEAIPEPLSTAVSENRPQVRAAQDALRDLQVGIQVELAQALSVTIRFNDNDGD